MDGYLVIQIENAKEIIDFGTGNCRFTFAISENI